MTRAQAIEAAARGMLAWAKRNHEFVAARDFVRDLDAALALPPDPAPSADERERALVREAIAIGTDRGNCDAEPLDLDYVRSMVSGAEIEAVIASVDATHPRQTAPSESVRGCDECGCPAACEARPGSLPNATCKHGAPLDPAPSVSERERALVRETIAHCHDLPGRGEVSERDVDDMLAAFERDGRGGRIPPRPAAASSETDAVPADLVQRVAEAVRALDPKAAGRAHALAQSDPWRDQRALDLVDVVDELLDAMERPRRRVEGE